MGFFDMLMGGGMDKFVDQAKENGALLLDVREKSEFIDGHVPGAVNIPLGALESQATSKLKDKNSTIYVYCLSGARSASARNLLKSLGYTDVTNIGGIGSYHGEITKGTK